MLEFSRKTNPRALLVLLIATLLAMVAISPRPALAATAVEEGVYEIINVGSEKALDIKRGRIYDNSANVQIYTPNHAMPQRWTVKKSGSHYTITNSISGRALDVSGWGKSNGTNIAIYEASGRTNQQWDFISSGNGVYQIRSVFNGLNLDVTGGKTANSTNVQLWSPKNNGAQKWRLVKVSPSINNGTYTVASSLNTNKVIDVPKASKDNSTKLAMYDNNGKANQKWSFIYDNKTGFYHIVSVNSRKGMDVPGANGKLGANVTQYTYANSRAQLWSVVDKGDGSYSILSATTGRAIEVGGNSAYNGALLVLADPSGAAKQSWKLTSVSAVPDGLYQFETALNSERVLDVKGGSLSESAALQIYSKNGTLAQKWVVKTQKDGSVALMNAASGLYLCESAGTLKSATKISNSSKWTTVVDPKGGVVFQNLSSRRAIDLSKSKTAAGSPVGVYGKNGGRNQTWNTVQTAPLDEGTYIFKNRANTSYVMDVKGAKEDNGTPLQLYKNNGTNAQKWMVEKAGNGTYTITSVSSGKAVDVSRKDAFVGKVLTQYTFNGGAAQTWEISIGSTGGLVFTTTLGNYAIGTSGNKTASQTQLCLQTPGKAKTTTWLASPTTPKANVKPGQDIWNDSAYIAKMIARAKKTGSSTGWFCTVDKAKGRVVVLYKSGSNWIVAKTMNCITSGNTFTGTFKVDHKNGAYYDGTRNINDYWTCFLPAYSSTNPASVGGYKTKYYPGKGYDDGQGFHHGYSSGGCTVVKDRAAVKYIYDNVSIGSTVQVF